MSDLAIFTVTTLLAFGTPSMAAIGCKPGMGNCPGPTDPSSPSIPSPGPSLPTTYSACGYVEVPSPDCKPEDRALARQISQEKAFQEARNYWGTDNLIELPGSFWSESCEKGAYANSHPGLSWIAQYFADYKKAE